MDERVRMRVCVCVCMCNAIPTEEYIEKRNAWDCLFKQNCERMKRK